MVFSCLCVCVCVVISFERISKQTKARRRRRSRRGEKNESKVCLSERKSQKSRVHDKDTKSLVFASVDVVYTTAIGIEMLPNINSKTFLCFMLQNKITKINKTTPTMIKSDEKEVEESLSFVWKEQCKYWNDLNEARMKVEKQQYTHSKSHTIQMHECLATSAWDSVQQKAVRERTTEREWIGTQRNLDTSNRKWQ